MLLRVCKAFSAKNCPPLPALFPSISLLLVVTLLSHPHDITRTDRSTGAVGWRQSHLVVATAGFAIALLSAVIIREPEREFFGGGAAGGKSAKKTTETATHIVAEEKDALSKRSTDGEQRESFSEALAIVFKSNTVKLVGTRCYRNYRFCVVLLLRPKPCSREAFFRGRWFVLLTLPKNRVEAAEASHSWGKMSLHTRELDTPSRRQGTDRTEKSPNPSTKKEDHLMITPRNTPTLHLFAQSKRVDTSPSKKKRSFLTRAVLLNPRVNTGVAVRLPTAQHTIFP